MTAAFPTRLETRSANSMAQRLADDAADALYDAGCRAVDGCARVLSYMKEAGAKADDIALCRDALLDAFSSIQHGINTTRDNAGLNADQHQIDTSELVWT